MKKIIVSRYSLKNRFKGTEFNPYTMKNNTNNINSIILNRNAGSPYCQTSGENCPRQDIHRADRRFKYK